MHVQRMVCFESCQDMQGLSDLTLPESHFSQRRTQTKSQANVDGWTLVLLHEWKRAPSKLCVEWMRFLWPDLVEFATMFIVWLMFRSNHFGVWIVQLANQSNKQNQATEEKNNINWRILQNLTCCIAPTEHLIVCQTLKQCPRRKKCMLCKPAICKNDNWTLLNTKVSRKEEAVWTCCHFLWWQSKHVICACWSVFRSKAEPSRFNLDHMVQPLNVDHMLAETNPQEGGRSTVRCVSTWQDKWEEEGQSET